MAYDPLESYSEEEKEAIARRAGEAKKGRKADWRKFTPKRIDVYQVSDVDAATLKASEFAEGAFYKPEEARSLVGAFKELYSDAGPVHRPDSVQSMGQAIKHYFENFEPEIHPLLKEMRTHEEFCGTYLSVPVIVPSRGFPGCFTDEDSRYTVPRTIPQFCLTRARLNQTEQEHEDFSVYIDRQTLIASQTETYKAVVTELERMFHHGYGKLARKLATGTGQDGDWAGLKAWLPEHVTPGDNFYGVDRSCDRSRLAGTYYDGRGFPAVEAAMNAYTCLLREGGNPNRVVGSFDDWELLRDIAQRLSKGPLGTEVKYYALPGLEHGELFLLQLDTWNRASIGKPVQLREEDGIFLMRDPLSDRFKAMLLGYGNFYCHVPQFNGRMKWDEPYQRDSTSDNATMATSVATRPVSSLPRPMSESLPETSLKKHQEEVSNLLQRGVTISDKKLMEQEKLNEAPRKARRL